MPRVVLSREVLLVFTAVSVVTWLLTHAPGPTLETITPLLLGAVFLYIPLTLSRREPQGAQRFGIDLCGLLDAPEDEPGGLAGIWALARCATPALARELAVALAACALVFPPFVVGFRLFHGITTSFELHLPDEPLDFVLGQLMVVALPEEALFRGYFQTRLTDLFGQGRRVLGAELSVPALLCQAALFALLHFVVAFDPSRLSVFFPALAFGYLRALRGGIGAAIWFHALSNVLSELLSRGFA